MIKLLKESVANYGANAPYTVGIIQALASDYKLIPYDWNAIAKAVLAPGQYLQFKSWWWEEARRVAMINAQQNPPGSNFDQLTGTGTHSSLQQQVLLEDAVIHRLKLVV